MRSRVDSIATLCVLAVVTLIACGQDAKREQPSSVPSNLAAAPPSQAGPVPPRPAPIAMDAGTQTTGDVHPMKKVADMPPLNDDQVAAVVVALNQGELDQAELVKSKTDNEDVKKFAQHMIDDHGAWLKDANDLVKKKSMHPAANDLSKELTSDSTTLVKNLGDKRGADLDKAYVDAQVTGHEGALDVIDMRLLKDVKSEDLKKALETVRPKVAAHLAHAQELQAKLENPSDQGTERTTNKHAP